MMFPQHLFYHDMALQKPRILMSACLLGDRVRYDGLDKSVPVIADFFRDHADVSKVCPEVGAGFGVPRSPVALHDTAKGIQALGVGNTALNVTDDLAYFSREFAGKHQHFQGAVLKSRSPSCGFGSTPVSRSGQQYQGNGIFAGIISEQWTQCLITEETALATIQACEDFLLCCYVMLDIQQTQKEETGLLQAHYAHCFSIDASLAIRCQPVSGFLKPIKNPLL